MTLRNRIAVLLLSAGRVMMAQESQYVLVARPLALDLRVAAPQGGVPLKDLWFDYDNAVLQQNYVLDLIRVTTGRCKSEEPAEQFSTKLRPCKPGEKEVFPGKDDNILFHVVNWNSSPASGLTVSKQNWYIYNTDPNWDYTSFIGARIFGKKQVYLFTIHLNRPASIRYEERYAVDEKHKTPAFLGHLVAVGQLFLPNPGAKGAETSPDAWYAFRLDVKYVPSDLQITPTMVPDAAPPGPVSPAVVAPPAPAGAPNPSLGPPPATVPAPGASAGPVTPPPPATVPAPGAPTGPVTPPPPAAGAATAATAAPAGKPVTLDAKTFDNEGKYHIDFSVAVPITKISELSYTQASNTIVPASVEKQKLFALFNYYPVAVDIKNTILPKFPYVLAGVAIGSQPLKRALFGLGWGPVYTNFYVGMLLNTQRVPSSWKCGDKTPAPAPAGTMLENRTCPEFSFGLNVGVGAITDALKNKASSSTGKK